MLTRRRAADIHCHRAEFTEEAPQATLGAFARSLQTPPCVHEARLRAIVRSRLLIETAWQLAAEQAVGARHVTIC